MRPRARRTTATVDVFGDRPPRAADPVRLRAVVVREAEEPARDVRTGRCDVVRDRLAGWVFVTVTDSTTSVVSGMFPAWFCRSGARLLPVARSAGVRGRERDPLPGSGSGPPAALSVVRVVI